MIIVACVSLMFMLFFHDQHVKAIYLDEDRIPNKQTTPYYPAADKAIVDEINSRNALIKTFQCDIRCEVQHKLLVKVSGKLAYEKPKSSRLVFESFLGVEADLGSNNKLFWFWSKKMQPRALYYALHEDLWKTRLKPGLHPLWMMECLTFDVIDFKNINFENYNGKLLLRKFDVGINGEPVTRLIIIDRNQKVIIGHYLLDQTDKLISSMEVTEFIGQIPKSMLVIWQDPMGQRVSLKWTLTNQSINDTIPTTTFQLPSFSPSVDMGKD